MGIPVWDQAVAEALAAAPQRERQARQVKASKLVAVMTEAGCTDGDVVRDLPLGARTIAEKAAKVRPASELTWALVARMIDDLAKQDAEIEAFFDRMESQAKRALRPWERGAAV